MVDGKLISSKDTFKEAYDQAKKSFPKKDPFIAKIPGKKVMIL